MKKKIVIFIYLLLIATMPFISYNCEGIRLKISPEGEDKVIEYWGYTVGFPIAFAQVTLNPFSIKHMYSIGYLDFLIVLFGFYVYGVMQKRSTRGGRRLNNVIKWFLAYVVLHFLFNLYIPLLSVYSKSFSRFGTTIYSVFYFWLYDRIYQLIGLYIGETIAVRLNFVFIYLFLFAIGVLFLYISRLLKLRLKSQFK